MTKKDIKELMRKTFYEGYYYGSQDIKFYQPEGHRQQCYYEYLDKLEEKS